jgi:hypothetical protein
MEDYDDRFRDTYIARDVSPKAENIMRRAIHDAMKEVIELGFLYINRRIDITPILDLASVESPRNLLEKEFMHRRWVPYSHNQGATAVEKQARHNMNAGTDPLGTEPQEVRLSFLLPTVKTWCSQCEDTTLQDSLPYAACPNR